MPIYEYKGLNAAGESATGILNADSPREARNKLRKDNVFVTTLTEANASSKPSSRKFELKLPRFLQKKRGIEVGLVTRQLATLLEAGIPLTDAIGALIEQVADQNLEKVIRDVREKVTQGASFGEALANHPDYFNDLYVNMVKAGEAGGNLDIVLTRLADYSAKQTKLRNRIGAALAYPIIMVIIGITVVTVLMTFVVPKIIQVVAQAGQKLPLVTVVLIKVSNSVRDFWWAMLLAVFAIATLLRIVYRTESGRFFFDRFFLRMPIFGELFRKQAVVRFSTTFSTLLKSGIPVLEALLIVRDIVNNKVLANTIQEVHKKILEGADIATPLKASGVFPPVVGYMVAVGEQSGRLEAMLDKISEAYEDEIDTTTQKVMSVIEPLIIVVLAVVVAFIVLAILLPILQQTKAVG
ncbi:MAG: type II secretion system inner membrane protein GspF [Planctomycetes bacterium]|nr:type II secretion system inner membrane protein GspF [Planctomycetota bacterium]MBI3844458.1 type II secretion system inner membrane protein GspF [Planctomycetota bacterium]